jgi:hypothetical protein
MVYVRSSNRLFSVFSCFIMLLIETCLPFRPPTAAPTKKSASPISWGATNHGLLAALKAQSATRGTALVLRGGTGRGSGGIDYARFDALECSDAPGSSSAVTPPPSPPPILTRVNRPEAMFANLAG